MDFTATVKGRKVPIGTVRRIAAADKACPKPCYSRPKAVPGRGGRRQRSPGRGTRFMPLARSSRRWVGRFGQTVSRSPDGTDVRAGRLQW